jgi:hypothetical protein
MKELLEALKKFGENPDAVGDNLFSFFAAITAMNWQDCVAAGHAINALKKEAWERALDLEKIDPLKKALKNPTVCRLQACMNPVRSRVIELLLMAPVEQRAALLESVAGREGFLFFFSSDGVEKKLGIAD